MSIEQAKAIYALGPFDAFYDPPEYAEEINRQYDEAKRILKEEDDSEK